MKLLFIYNNLIYLFYSILINSELKEIILILEKINKKEIKEKLFLEK